jgi:hypothetical protein
MSEQLVFERHVGFGLETDAGTEDVGQGIALLSESVDDGGAGRCHGSLDPVSTERYSRKGLWLP